MKWIIWHITDTCNIACTYCYTSSSPFIKDASNAKEKLNIAKSIGYFQPRLVTIIGGEPLTVKNLPDIISILKRNGVQNINIDTNGMLIAKKWHENFNLVDRFNVSIDAISEELHDVNRGGFRDVLKGLECIKSSVAELGCNITVGTHNHANLFDIAEFCIKAGATIISFGRAKPIGRGQAFLRKNGELNEAQVRKCADQLILLKQKHSPSIKIIVSGFYDVALFEAGLIERLPVCLCGEYKMTVSADGTAFPCEAMPFVNGPWNMFDQFKVHKTKPEDIAQSELFRMWRKHIYTKSDECLRCKYTLYCDGGCAATQLAASGFRVKEFSCQL